MSHSPHVLERSVAILKSSILGMLLLCCSAIVICLVPTVNAQDLRFVVFSEGKHGYIDQTGRIVIPINFHQTYVIDFSEGFAEFSIFTDPEKKIPYLDQGGRLHIRPEEKWGFINVNGHTVIPPQFDKVMGFSEDLAAVAYNTEDSEPACIGCNPDQLWGFIDKRGNLVIKPQYQDVRSFSESLAAV